MLRGDCATPGALTVKANDDPPGVQIFLEANVLRPINRHLLTKTKSVLRQVHQENVAQIAQGTHYRREQEGPAEQGIIRRTARPASRHINPGTASANHQENGEQL